MQRISLAAVLTIGFGALSLVVAQEVQPEMKASGCLTCHEGIEPIRQPDSGMMRAILEEGENTPAFRSRPVPPVTTEASESGYRSRG